ncbi:hypothetical protein Pint_09606 [Pistacia integerrima]|uniref:Uncharacterized protein n=1 Tax=Pistacia integerrima TaxID=434235 RepID=A0ACC0XG84_9ROSI|nr:hypothetical protein Pint_09606 [Pistacia integerrima]
MKVRNNFEMYRVIKSTKEPLILHGAITTTTGNYQRMKSKKVPFSLIIEVQYIYLLDQDSDLSPAELKRVCWLQVTGKTKVKRGKSYEIEFNITLKADGFGWNGLPLFLMAKIGAKGKSIWKKIKPLEQTTDNKTIDIPKPDEKFIVKIPDNKGDEEQDLFFGFYEIWSNKWKGGLLINYATVNEVSEPN